MPSTLCSRSTRRRPPRENLERRRGRSGTRATSPCGRTRRGAQSPCRHRPSKSVSCWWRARTHSSPSGEPDVATVARRTATRRGRAVRRGGRRGFRLLSRRHRRATSGRASATVDVTAPRPRNDQISSQSRHHVKYTTLHLYNGRQYARADWAAWHVPGGPVGAPSRWAATSNVVSRSNGLLR